MAQTMIARSGSLTGVRRKPGMRYVRKTVLPHIGLALAGLLFLAPFAWLFITSIKSEQEIFAIPTVWWPDKIQWLNYVQAVQTIPFIQYTLNTVFVCVLSAVGQLFASPLVAYGFSRIAFRGRDFLFFVMMGTMILPFQVTMVPIYVMFNQMNMLDSYWPLILPNFFGAAYYIFLLRQFFMNIPYELTESAKIDGASEFRIYWQVILPLSRPALYTVALLTFLHAWGDFLGPLIYLNDPEKWTLSVGLRSFIGEYKVSWGLLMAASTLFTVPIIALYFFVQKQFIQGITLTGFK
ncbi:carbohydrate ABC transporter permease [Paenibacillus elgii]|uniref:carbohydrate ABC transporter permease n=1 Tax=Paenibacillus elgii TaxID=189691 RepID=UPI002D7D4D5A|nr:carbohydrate ABC transporter permease [Paenibacillus elgii]